MAPVPIPTTIPQQSTSCHDGVIQIGSSEPTLTSTQGDGDDALDAEPLHEGRREGGREAEEDEVDRDGTTDDAHRPAELVVQRRHEHARCRAEAGRADDRQEGDDGDPPRRVDRGGVRADGRRRRSVGR